MPYISSVKTSFSDPGAIRETSFKFNLTSHLHSHWRPPNGVSKIFRFCRSCTGWHYYPVWHFTNVVLPEIMIFYPVLTIMLARRALVEPARWKLPVSNMFDIGSIYRAASTSIH